MNRKQPFFVWADQPQGYYGQYGGSFIPEILHSTLQELCIAFEHIQNDPAFWQDFLAILKEYSGRPTPITHAKNLSQHFNGAQIFFKREDLNHTGAHKITNALGQGLLVQRMGKKRVIAETGAGQHGVATATMAAKLGLDCTIYMGTVDIERQRPNVFWMEQMGAEVIPVTAGSATLKDAINEAMRDWVNNMQDTHYVLGTACGAHPFPKMVAFFQSVVGKEAQAQMLELWGKPPNKVFACVGGGSNALGIFSGFYDNPHTELVGVEAGGLGLSSQKHATRISKDASPGIAQGYKTLFLQNQEGQMNHTHSIAAGLDYIGISPILAYLNDAKKVRFESATDEEVIEALRLIMRKEGIIPALESCHGFARAFVEAKTMQPDQCLLINQSGRGDKDIFTIGDALNEPKWNAFLKSKALSLDA